MEGQIEPYRLPSGTDITPRSPTARHIAELFFLNRVHELEALLNSDDEPADIYDIPFHHLGNLTSSLWATFQADVSGRRFAITTSGYMALVPPYAKASDLLVHVRGCFAPLVVRRKQGNNRHVELVGVCSVQGIDDVYSGLDWIHFYIE